MFAYLPMPTTAIIDPSDRNIKYRIALADGATPASEQPRSG